MAKVMVSEQRNYAVTTVEDAKRVASAWLESMQLEHAAAFGLPEVDDRYHVWRVPIVAEHGSRHKVGEVVIDARTTLVLQNRSSAKATLEARLLGRSITNAKGAENAAARTNGHVPMRSMIRNTIVSGDSEAVLPEFPAQSVGLVFTSPPYYNARPEYTDYVTYEEYLLKLRKVIQQVHRVLGEGRFFVINVSPVLIRRSNRNESSRRIAVPFDLHRIFVEEGYDFIDDIIWMKPEGAGWATGRGRRFAADRNPLQYKAVPVTEYVLVYRKRTERLIDWNIRMHPDQSAVEASRIRDGYERTNVWKLKPAHSKKHPAVFPVELAERVIEYYSFRGDAVLDPFAGIGTVGEAATKLGRRFVLIEQDPKYITEIRKGAPQWLGADADVLCVNCEPLEITRRLF